MSDYIDIRHVYPVGRLDYDSEGLMILTDDGEFNNSLSDPKHKKPKTYLAQVEGIATKEQAEKLSKGVMIEGRKTLPAVVKLIDEPKLWERSTPIRFRKLIPTSWLEISIVEGKNRQVRKMTAAVGLPCLRLVRIKIGEYSLGELEPGQYKISSKLQIPNSK